MHRALPPVLHLGLGDELHQPRDDRAWRIFAHQDLLHVEAVCFRVLAGLRRPRGAMQCQHRPNGNDWVPLGLQAMRDPAGKGGREERPTFVMSPTRRSRRETSTGGSSFFSGAAYDVQQYRLSSPNSLQHHHTIRSALHLWLLVLLLAFGSASTLHCLATAFLALGGLALALGGLLLADVLGNRGR